MDITQVLCGDCSDSPLELFIRPVSTLEGFAINAIRFQSNTFPKHESEKIWKLSVQNWSNSVRPAASALGCIRPAKNNKLDRASRRRQGGLRSASELRGHQRAAKLCWDALRSSKAMLRCAAQQDCAGKVEMRCAGRLSRL